MGLFNAPIIQFPAFFQLGYAANPVSSPVLKSPILIGAQPISRGGAAMQQDTVVAPYRTAFPIRIGRLRAVMVFPHTGG